MCHVSAQNSLGVAQSRYDVCHVRVSRYFCFKTLLIVSVVTQCKKKSLSGVHN